MVSGPPSNRPPAASNSLGELGAFPGNAEELLDFVDNAAVGVHCVGADGRILWANRTELELLGYEADEYIGRHISDFHVEPEVIRELLSRLDRRETLRSCEARLRAKDGTIKDVLLSSNVLWRDGRFAHTRCFTRDISERKAVEEQLRFQLSVLNEVHDAVIATDSEEKIRFWSAGAAHTFGYAEGEVLGQSPALLALRREEEGPAESREDPGGAGAVDELWRGRRKDGAEVWLRLRTTVQRDGAGHARGLVRVATDITKKKLAQDSLRLSQTHLEVVLGAGQMGTWGWDIATNRVQWSPGLERIHGLAPGAFRGTFEAFQSYVHPEDRARVTELISRTLADKRDHHIEYRIFSAQGSIRWVEGRGRLFLDARGNPERLLGVCQDITDRKAAEAERETLLEREGAARAKAELTAKRLGALAETSAALSGAVAVSDVLEVILGKACDLVGAGLATVYLFDEENGEVLRHAGSRGLAAPPPELGPISPGEVRCPLTMAARENRVVWMGTYAELVREFPGLKQSQVRPGQLQAVLAFPLSVAGQVLGAVGYSFEGERPADHEEQQFLSSLSEHCAQALARARVIEAATRAERRASFLAKASEILSSSLDYQRTLRSLVEVAAPTLADWSAVDILAGDDRIERLAVFHVDANRVELAKDFHARYPLELSDASGIGAVIRTGIPELVRDVPDVAIEAISDPERREATRALGIRSYVSVPLTARGRTMGALTLVYAESGRRYTEADLQVAEDLARRAAMAMDNARLYREAQAAGVEQKKRVEFEQQLIGIVAHDLRNPLNAVAMSSSLLLRRGGLDDVQGKAVARIISSTERASRLVRDFLDFAEARSSGSIPIRRGRANIHELARHVVEEVHLGHSERLVHLEHRGDADGEWDGDRIAQLIGNLVGNALQHSPPDAAVSVKTRGEADQAIIEVHNEGPPIPDADLPRLFQPFKRGGEAKTASGRGVGLGLFISQKIVAAHGGTISVNSEAEAGTTFTVRVPKRRHSGG